MVPSILQEAGNRYALFLEEPCAGPAGTGNALPLDLIRNSRSSWILFGKGGPIRRRVAPPFGHAS